MIEVYRKRIDKIDKKILSLLEERVKVSKDIGKYKRKNKIKIEDLKREKEIVEELGGKTNLDKKFIQRIYKTIFKFSKKIQK